MKIYEKEGQKYKDKTNDYILEDKNYEVDTYYDTNEKQFSIYIKKTYSRFREMFDSRDDDIWNKIKGIISCLWNSYLFH